MPSVNESLADRILTHAIYLERIKAGLIKETLRQLNTLEKSLIRDLQNANLTTFRKDRYERLLALVRDTIRTSYRTMRNGNHADLVDLADLESQWTVRALNGAVGVEAGVAIDVASIAWSTKQLEAIVSDAVLDGEVIATWWGKQASDLRLRFADTVKQGLLRGETTAEIVRKIRGGKGVEGIGLIETKRRQAEMLVRTSISTVSHEARMATYGENQEVLRGYQQRSVLDARTSNICIAYSNKTWALDGTPLGHTLPMRPFPRHWGERSQLLPITKSWSELAGRPIAQADNKTLDQLFQQRLRDMGWDEERIAKARRRTQASMDGQISRDISYEEFFAKKEKTFQRDVLGPGRFELYEKGLLRSLSDLVDFRGNPLTLKQLRDRYGL